VRTNFCGSLGHLLDGLIAGRRRRAFIALAAAANDVANARADVLEGVDADDRLTRDDLQVLGDRVSVDVVGSGDDRVGPPF